MTGQGAGGAGPEAVSTLERDGDAVSVADSEIDLAGGSAGLTDT